MAGSVNHRGWIVLTSVASADGRSCVDVFEDPAGGFGFESFRADPEDGGRWTAVGGFGTVRYPASSAAAEAALAFVDWLRIDPVAREQLRRWSAPSI